MEESVHEPVSVNRTTGITPELPPTTAEAPAPEDAAQTPEVAAVSFADGATVDLRRGSTEPDAKKAEWRGRCRARLDRASFWKSCAPAAWAACSRPAMRGLDTSWS